MKTSENWPHFPKAFSSGLYFRFVLFLYIPIPIPKYSYIPQYSYIFLYLFLYIPIFLYSYIFLYIPIFLYSCIFLYSGKKSSYGGKCMGTIGCLSMEIRDNISRLIQFIYIPIYSYIPIFLYIPICSFIFLYIPIYSYIFLHISIYSYIFLHRFVLFLYIPISIHIYSYIPIYSYIFLFIFIYSYIFLYTWSSNDWSFQASLLLITLQTLRLLLCVLGEKQEKIICRTLRHIKLETCTVQHFGTSN